MICHFTLHSARDFSKSKKVPWSSHKRQKERENKREKKVKTIRSQEERDMETPKSFRKQSYKNMHADWLKIMFL